MINTTLKTLRNPFDSKRTMSDWRLEHFLDRLLEQDFYKIHCLVKTSNLNNKRFVEVCNYGGTYTKSILLKEITHEDNPEDLYKKLMPEVKLLVLFGD
jgi:hypothetical protein